MVEGGAVIVPEPN